MDDERAGYRDELLALLAREIEKDDRQIAALAASRAVERQADAAGLLDEAREELAHARDRLCRLQDEIRAALPSSDTFNRFLLRAAPAFRASVGARSLLLRHTPPLAGEPAALEPFDDHRRQAKSHLTDYARSGDWVFDDPSRVPPIRIDDHPRLAAVAQSMMRTIYGDRSPCRALLFSSGMGAINTVLEYAAAEARRGQRRLIVGARSWLETRCHLDNNAADVVEYVDERDVAALRAALANPQVLGLFLETLVNHYDTPVVDLDAILDHANIRGRKLLMLDTVHTPEFDPFSRYFAAGIPPDLCVVSFVSAVKFFQAGWDISKAGLACFAWRPDDYAPGRSPYDKLIALRSVSGRVCSREEAELADLETPASFKSRLQRLDRNVRVLAEQLELALRRDALGYVSSPWLPSHPDHTHALAAYGTGGRFLYVILDGERFDWATRLRLDRTLTDRAGAAGIPLVSLNSFGLAIPNTGVLAAVRPEGPVLRLSPGSTDLPTCLALVELCTQVLRELARPVRTASMFLA